MSALLEMAPRAGRAQSGALKFLSVGRTHVGRVRTLNEDAFLNRPDVGIWAVADGMGGHARGDAASNQLIETLASVSSFQSAFDLSEQVNSAIQAVNGSLSANVDMSGATVVALMAYERQYSCVWAGDSRAYLYRNGALKRLTRDHTYVQGLVDAGALSEDEARRHPKANVVTRAVGASAELVLDEVTGSLQAGDRVLLCSDGLSGLVDERSIAEIVRRAPLEWAAQTLIDRALGAGGSDNVTVVMIAAE